MISFLKGSLFLNKTLERDVNAYKKTNGETTLKISFPYLIIFKFKMRLYKGKDG
ncbi:MAG: hypothetical protein BWX51_01652 [Bacteroidetes bacterium ADurb.Bin012]|jgi:hypothetical protein|nr:MAG: hypothetical protein BWX51_01652 [Bacteroidetes bacterium ADurb.Bin012]